MDNEELVKRYKSGDTMVLSELTENNLDLIKFVANKFTIGCSFISFDDLIQEGWTGFFRAVQTYNPDLPNSAKFSTWAVLWIKQAIQRYLEQKTPKSQEKSIYEEYGEDLAVLDSLEDPAAERNFWRYIENRELRKELDDTMGKYLTLSQREIIKMYYGWNSDICFTFTAIGEVLGLSKQSVVQQHNRAMRRLRESGWARKRYKEYFVQQRLKYSYSNPELAINYLVPSLQL